jgi:3-methyladenine DNA glycosylase AlkD
VTAATSPVTATSNRFVAEHLDAATALGERLVDLVADPAALVAELSRGFAALGDPVYADGVRSVTPGLGPVFGVRLPLMDAAQKAFKRGTRKTSPGLLLECAARLLHEKQRELRWFGMWNLSRLLPTEPDRTWRLLRQAAAQADEWISVDTLAHPWADGILRDSRRWAELDRLLRSPSRWERRLVGSTIATAPHGRGPADDHRSAIVDRGLALVGQLIGDAEPDVQKALSWALRTVAQVDAAATIRFLEAETQIARAGGDGHRAWVIRDSLSKLPPPIADRLRAELDGIRRKPGAPSTSRTATTSTTPED